MAQRGSLSVTWGIKVWYSSGVMYLEDPDDTSSFAPAPQRQSQYRQSAVAPSYSPSAYAPPPMMTEQAFGHGLLPHAQMPYQMMQQPCVCPQYPPQYNAQFAPSFGAVMPPVKSSTYVSPTTALLGVIVAWWLISKDSKDESK